MPLVGKVVTQAGNAEPISPKQRHDPASSANFDESLNQDAILVGRGSQPPVESEERPDVSWSETARQRTIEELRTLLRAIQSGVTDQFQLTDLIFYARHPELIGVPLTKNQQVLLDEWNAISALLVHPTLNEVGNILGANVIGGELRPQEIQWAFERAAQSPLNLDTTFGDSGRFDQVIFQSVQWCPGLSPSILKGLLAQESNFNPTVINQYGYAGIAQFGRVAAREVGLQVGIAGSEMDERLNPYKAIPAAARLLNLKAQRLGDLAFSRYGQPDGVEFWKFVLAAYNGGEGTIALAMGHAYRNGLARAKGEGLVGYDAVSFARSYASKWENLKAGGQDSPLGMATARYFPLLALSKYHEIGNYPTAIVARSLHARI